MSVARGGARSAAPPNAVERLLRRVAGACMAVACVGLTAMVAAVAWGVFGRYVLNDSPDWVEPAVQVLMSWFILLGAAVGVREGDHLGFDLGLAVAPAPLRRIMELVNMAVVGGCGALMAWHGWRLAARTWADKMSGLPLPVGAGFIPVILGGALIILFAAARAAAPRPKEG